MSNLKITVEAFPGSDIPHLCIEMQGLANRLGVNVVTSMNGVKCMAVPGGNPVLLAERQRASQADKFDLINSVSSRPEVQT